jgi:hypothetical protein
MIPIEDIELLIKKLRSQIPKSSLHDINTYYDGRRYGERMGYGCAINELKLLLKKHKTK